MKISKIFAGMSAAAMLAAIAIPASATENALASVTVNENSKPNGGGYNYHIDPIADVEGITPDNISAVDKIVVGFTNQEFVNGTIGGNTVAKNGWDSVGQIDTSNAGENTWTWDSIGGLKIDEDGTAAVEVQIWWMNAIGDDASGYKATTLTIDSISFFDGNGNLIGILDADNKPAVTTTTTTGDPTPTTTTTTTAPSAVTTTTTTTASNNGSKTTTKATTTVKAAGNGAANNTNSNAAANNNAATGSSASAAFAAAGVALAGAAIVAAKKRK